MQKVALVVQLNAKPGKEKELAEFLAGAQPMAMAEPETITWYALQIDAHTFSIFDTFNDDAGRQAHLNGPIAAALMAHAEDLLATLPIIRHVDVLATKAPS